MHSICPKYYFLSFVCQQFLKFLNLQISVCERNIPVQIISMKKKTVLNKKYVNKELKFKPNYFLLYLCFPFCLCVKQFLFIRCIIKQIFTLFSQDQGARQLICYMTRLQPRPRNQSSIPSRFSSTASRPALRNNQPPIQVC